MIKSALQRARYVCLFLPLLVLAASAQSAGNKLPENIHFKRLVESEDNQRLSYISTMASAPDGFLWIGTGQGLLRYDGEYTTFFKSQPQNPNSLTSDYIRSLAFDQNGILWIATEYGLNSYNPKLDQFAQYLENSEPRSISSNLVKSAIVASDNRVYVGTAEGIDVFSPDRKQVVHLGHEANTSNSLSQSNVVAMMESRSGNIWIGTEGGGVNVYNPNTGAIKQYLASEQANSVIDNHVTTLCEDRDGRIWIGTQGKGLSRYNQGVFENYTVGYKPGEIPDGTIYQIFEDHQGTIWVLTDRAGALVYNASTDQFSSYRHNPYDSGTLLGNTAKAIVEDKDNNIWISTFPIGLNYFDRTSGAFDFLYRVENQSPTLSHSTILDIQRGSDGRLWVGTELGLNIVDETTGEITIYSKTNTQGSLSADAVLAIQEDIDGKVWLGTWGGGVSKFDPKTGKIERYETGTQGPGKIKSPFVWDIFLDSNNTLWVGTETDGLNRYDRNSNSFVSYNHKNNDDTTLSYDYIWDIIEDEDGYLWLATQLGLNRFDKKTQTFKSWLPDANNKKAITASRIQDLLIDSRGYLWMATQGGGINRFNRNTEEFEHLRSSQGLPSDAVSQLLEDASGYIWAGTASGLVKIDPETFTIETVLTESNGLHHDEFIRNAAHKDNNGTLYFGSVKGIVSFKPSELVRESDLPEARLTGLKIFNQPVSIGAPDSPLQKRLTETSEINLSVKESVITLDFSTINFNKHFENRFSYKLENFDKQWTHLERSHSATYTNLSPGKYTFKLSTRNRQNQLSNHVVTLGINVATPWWRSWYALALYVLLIGLFVIIVIRLYLLHFTTQQLNLLVAQRTGELERANAAKTDFLANMSHELRTPLNSIIGFSKRLLKKIDEQSDPTSYRALDAIFRNGVHLLNIINDILDVSKIEAGKLKLEVLPCNLPLTIEQQIEDMLPRAEEKGLKLIKPESYPFEKIDADPVRLKQIINNLLSNAIKYTREGQIAIAVSKTSNAGLTYCKISVSDTGIGIRQEDQEKLFSRFEQFDSDTKHQRGFGTGLGLALVYSLTQAHDGFIEFSSEFGKGSNFHINLPVTQKFKRVIAPPQENDDSL